MAATGRGGLGLVSGLGLSGMGAYSPRWSARGKRRGEGLWIARRLRRQDHLADVLAVLEKMVRRRGFGEGKAPRDSRLDRSFRPELEHLPGPDAHEFGIVPKVLQIDAEDALVRVHQGERIELEPRRAREHR